MWQRIIAGTAVVALFVPLIAAQSNSALAQAQALCKIGDFDAALEVFDRISRESSSNTELAAEALIQRAGCSVFRGQLAARESYERVIRDYPDQPLAVNGARKSLRALAPLDVLSVVYLVDIQPHSGDVQGPVTRLTETANAVEKYPTWSPDGKFIAYRGSGGRGSAKIIVRSLASGEENSYDGQGEGIGPSLWLKAGQELLSIPVPAGGASGIFMGRHLNGSMQELGTPGFSIRTSDVSVSKKDEKLYAHVVGGSNNLRSEVIAVFDLTSGRTTGKFVLGVDVAPASNNLPEGGRSIAISPDGNRLAIARRSSEFDASIVVCGAHTEGKDCKTLVSDTGPLLALTWTADGGGIIYARSLYSVSSGEVSRIMRVAENGGTPTCTGLEVRGMTYLDLNPEGTRLAFDGIAFKISSPCNAKGSR